MAGLLEGKAVVITGAGGGLGRAYALAAGAEGASVVVNDHDAVLAHRTVEELQISGGVATAIVGDISIPDVARGLIHACLDRFGKIDGLVNNAGVSSAGPSWEAADEDVAHLFGVNVMGVIAATATALPAMMRRGSGSIINIISGAILGMEDLTLYGGTKGAVLGLTNGWAVEAAGTGVRVNALSPLARTSMSDIMEDIPEEYKGPAPERIAPVVTALLSDSLAHLNGQTIRFDGERLGFMTPPGKGPGTRQDSWSAQSVVEAFTGELRDRGTRLGLAPRDR